MARIKQEALFRRHTPLRDALRQLRELGRIGVEDGLDDPSRSSQRGRDRPRVIRRVWEKRRVFIRSIADHPCGTGCCVHTPNSEQRDNQRHEETDLYHDFPNEISGPCAVFVVS